MEMKPILFASVLCSAMLHLSPIAASNAAVETKEKPLFRTMPYLQSPAEDGMTVIWQTNYPAYSYVEYGTDSTQLQRARLLRDGQVICNNTIHKIRLEDLEPGQRYFYRICSKEITEYKAYSKKFGLESTSPFYQFKTPDAHQDEFTAVIYNDLHKNVKTLKALHSHVDQLDYDLVIFNGDCVDDPATRDQATDFLNDLQHVVRAHEIPTMYVRGNHEIRNAYSIGLRDLVDYIQGETYGAFTLGDTRFIILDCGEDKPDDHWVYYDLNDFTQFREIQADFLRNERKSKAFKKADHRVLIHHIPLYGNDYDYVPCLPLWEPELKKMDIDCSINAHTHVFAHHPTNTINNPYPVVIGGGPGAKDATVVVLQKKEGKLTLKVINTQGETLLSEEL